MLNTLKGMLFFAAFAPPLGGAILGLSMAIWDAGSMVGMTDLIQVALGFALFSYLFGGIPALVTGAVAGFFRHRLGNLRPCFFIGLVGFVLSLMFQYENSSNLNDIRFFLTFGVPAFLSGTAICALFGKKPNNSFNRTR